MGFDYNETQRIIKELKDKLGRELKNKKPNSGNIKNFINTINDLGDIADKAQKNQSTLHKINTISNKVVTPFLAGIGVVSALKTIKDDIPDVFVDKKIDKMINLKPNLASIDRKLLKKYYHVVKNVAPNTLNNPIVAASLLERVINYGGVDHTMIKELADTEKALKDRKANPIISLLPIIKK